MVQSQITRWLMIGVTCLGTTTTGLSNETAKPPNGRQAEQRRLRIRDIKLADGGVLKGQLVTPQGSPLLNETIQVSLSRQVVASTTTASEGTFVIRGLRGGNYTIDAKGAKAVVRLWAAGTAPPVAAEGALLVAPGETVRGSFGGISDGILRFDEYKGVIAAAGLITGAAIIMYNAS